MPRATVQQDNTHRFELKTCPEGFVVLRQLSYGQMLERRAMGANLRIEAKRGKKDVAGEMALMQKIVTEYEFRHCVVDHNLEDEDGRKLDFGSPGDLAKLDPRVGSEIDKYINKLNQDVEDDDEEGDS